MLGTKSKSFSSYIQTRLVQIIMVGYILLEGILYKSEKIRQTSKAYLCVFTELELMIFFYHGKIIARVLDISALKKNHPSFALKHLQTAMHVFL